MYGTQLYNQGVKPEIPREKQEEHQLVSVQKEGYRAYHDYAAPGNPTKLVIVLKKEKDRDIQKLREERNAALAQAKRIAEEFAQVNLDEASDLYKEAFVCFQNGDIDKTLVII